MPRATRRLLPIEIAQIWARNVLAVRTQEGVARLSASSRDRQVGPILRVSEMVKALPDRSIPDPVRNVLIKFGCSPSQEPLLWVSECLRREKFVLLGSFIEELIDPTSPSNKATRESVFLVLSTHFKNYGADNQEARDVARLCALSYVSEIKEHIDDCRHTDISPASNVGGVCALIVAAECMDEVFSEIPARDWKVFFRQDLPERRNRISGKLADVRPLSNQGC